MGRAGAARPPTMLLAIVSSTEWASKTNGEGSGQETIMAR